jgi:hypothetical protein
MSIWLTEAFIGAVLCKNGCWMRTLFSEKDSDGGFSFIVWKRHIVICSEVHAVSADLPFHRSDTKLGPAGKFAINSASNAPGSAACRCRSTARCNCRLESYDPVLLVFYMGLGEVSKVYFE